MTACLRIRDQLQAQSLIHSRTVGDPQDERYTVRSNKAADKRASAEEEIEKAVIGLSAMMADHDVIVERVAAHQVSADVANL